MLDFSIRTSTLEDIDFAVRITSREKWRYSKEDFTLMFLSEFGDQFIAEDATEKRKIGMLSTFKYSGKLAWIGNVVVLEEYRNKGVATALMKHALKQLKKEGVKTIRLYSYMNAEPFYLKLNFTREGILGVFSKKISRKDSESKDETPSNKDGVITVDEIDSERLFEFDKKCFGSDRRKVLSSIISSKGRICLVKLNEKSRKNVIGYIMGTREKGALDVGPWLCDPDRADTAEALLSAAMNRIGVRKVTLTASLENAVSTNILQKLHFMRTMDILKMRKERNLYNGKPAWIFAAAGLEKG